MPKEDLRIQNHPILEFKRGSKIEIQFDKRALTAYEGETLAAALYANGIRIFSRSFKYHRPRGIFCLCGHCSNCLMRVNGIPNVRVCTIPVQANMKIQSQNAWPSLQFDAASLADYLDFLVRPGFQYRRFIRPRWAYHIWERFLRKAAGIGTLSEVGVQPPATPMEAAAQIVVVGGGVAGMSAGLHAGREGAEVWLIEKESVLGGRWRYQTNRVQFSEIEAPRRAFKLAVEMESQIESLVNCRVLKRAIAFGWYDESILAVFQPKKFWMLRPNCLIISTGSYETPRIFENNDLPGIFLSGGLQRLMHRDGIRPGRRAVVSADNENGYHLARQLLEAGVSVVAVADYRNEETIFTCREARRISDDRIPIYPEHHIHAASGRRRVTGVGLSSTHNHKKVSRGSEIKIACDTVGLSGNRFPANELIFQRTCRGSYILESPYHIIRRPESPRHCEVETGLYVAGEAGGSFGLRRAYLEGKIAGLSAALSLGYGDGETKRARDESEQALKKL